MLFRSTESDFVDSLVNEINSKSGAISMEQTPDKLSAEMIKKICELYETTEEDLLQILDDNDVIKRNNDFKENGFTYIKQNYPKIFEGVNSTKVRKATDDKKKITVRTDKYIELKDLWEKLNEKVILEYKFDKEAEFKNLFTEFLKAQKGNFTIDGVSERVAKVEIKDDRAIVNEAESIYGRNVATISTMKYSDFLKELSKILNINLATIHQSIIDAGTDINKHLNPTTLRIIKDKFDHFLMANAIDKFSIEYKKVSNNIHPTKLTDEKGNVLSEISASDIGIFFSDEDVAKSYFFEELYYDSELEMKNIKTEINEVIVFTKIPKNSIKIPVAGGKTYSPDFAYVLKFKDGKQKLNFIVETKDVGSDDGLREEEKAKIIKQKDRLMEEIKNELAGKLQSEQDEKREMANRHKKEIEEKSDSINSIGNLVLLNGSANSSLSNNPYYIKKQLLFDKIKQGFLLPHTLKVFSKSFNSFSVISYLVDKSIKFLELTARLPKSILLS